jgi:hypothetical protein
VTTIGARIVQVKCFCCIDHVKQNLPHSETLRPPRSRDASASPLLLMQVAVFQITFCGYRRPESRAKHGEGVSAASHRRPDHLARGGQRPQAAPR